MKRRIYVFSFFIAITAVMVINSCKKSSTTAIEVGTLMIGNIELNGATRPNNVPVNPVITATFTADVDPATATSSNIKLTQAYDTLDIQLTIIGSSGDYFVTQREYLTNHPEGDELISSQVMGMPLDPGTL